MRRNYTDSIGRKFEVEAPEDFDGDLKYANIIGPPLLENLQLPVQLEVRLHNELYARGILTKADARKRRNEIVSILQRVLAIDVDRIQEAFQ